MAAPTNAARVKKVLANSEPSTHGPFRPRLLLSNLELITLETFSARIRPEDLDPLKGRFSGHPQHTGQPETDFRFWTMAKSAGHGAGPERQPASRKKSPTL